MRTFAAIKRHHGAVAVIAFVLALSVAVAVPVPAAASTGPTGGTQQWARRYNDLGNGTDRARAVAVSPDGTRVYVTGSGAHGSGRTSSAFTTVAYDAVTGARIWVQRYVGIDKGGAGAGAIAVSPDGTRVYVTGSSLGDGGPEYATVAYAAATGTRLWEGRYAGPGESIATALAVSPDSTKVYVTGFSEYGESFDDFVTLAYNAVTGGQIWVSRYSGPGDAADWAHSIAVSPDGARVYVAGGSFGDSHDYATLAYNAVTGGQVWVRTSSGPESYGDVGAIAVSPDGTKVYLTGPSESDGSDDYATVAYNAITGADVWVQRYDGPANGDDSSTAITVSSDSASVYVTGTSGEDYATAAYDAVTGAQVWVRRFNGPANGTDMANAMALSPDGTHVYVTGQSAGPVSLDFATLAYNTANGARLWVRRYNGPGRGIDLARAVTVSPDGNSVYVTGESLGSGTDYDYATIAYHTG